MHEHQYLIDEVLKTRDEVLALLEQCPPHLLSYKIAENKWSILEIMEHLVVVDKGSYLAMQKTDEPPTPKELEAMEQRFNGLKEKARFGLVAPPSAEPKGRFASKEEVMEAFTQIRERIVHFASENELNSLGKGHEHPKLGYLTRSQWLRFIIWHARHHGKQIQHILDKESRKTAHS